VPVPVPVPVPVAEMTGAGAESESGAEGYGRIGRDRPQHYRIAYASARGVDVHLRILCVSRPSHRNKATTALQLFDDVRAMKWRLLHPSS